MHCNYSHTFYPFYQIFNHYRLLINLLTIVVYLYFVYTTEILTNVLYFRLISSIVYLFNLGYDLFYLLCFSLYKFIIKPYVVSPRGIRPCL